MRVLAMLAMLAMSGLLLMACGEKDGDDSGTESSDSGSSGSSDGDTQLAEDLWTAMSGYSGWNQLTGWEGVVASADGTHGDYVQIWANDTAYSALLEGIDLPEGSILVKEGYDDAEGSSLKSLTAMQKITGYDSANGDWFWAQLDADSGAASNAGSLSGCYGCHSAYSGYVAFDD